MKLKAGLLTLAFCGMGLTSSGQNISEIAKSDPLIISGAIGTQNTFNYSTSGGVSSSMWNNTVFANLNFTVYGVNMPFSFSYTNSGGNFNYPHFSYRFNTTFRNWSLYLGKHTMAFNSYVYNVPVDGVGLEYRNNRLRLGVFYGQLRKSINDDPNDPSARNPQFARYGWGFKAGYGSGSNFIDLYVFHASDRKGSLNEEWFNRVTPHDNLVVGVKGRVAVKRFSVNANVATSVFTTDTRAEELDPNIVGKWDKIFDARLTSLYRFAGDISANYSIGNYSIGANYKMVQPDYMSLGTNYISNNIQSYGVNASGTLFRGRVSMSGTFSCQQDNLTNRQVYTTSGYVYGANVAWSATSNLNFTASYNGYRQIQTDGTEHVNDTTQVNRVMHGLTAGASYTLAGETLGHMIGTSYSFSRNLDLNRFATGESDITTNAVGANYGLQVVPIGMTFNMGYNWQLSKDYSNTFSTHMLTFGTGRGFLENKELNVSLNASVSMNRVGEQKTTSYGVSLSSGYTLLSKHVFSLVGSYNHYVNSQPGWTCSMEGTSYTVSLNYNYAFTLLHIKRKSKDKENVAKKPRRERTRRVFDDLGKMVSIGF